MTVTKKQIDDIQKELNVALSFFKETKANYWDGKVVALTKVLQILHS